MRQNVSRGLEIWKYLAPYICFQTPPLPRLASNICTVTFTDALGGDEGVGMGGYLISLLLLLIYDDYPSKS